MPSIPIYEMILSEEEKESGVSLISFVETPAIESNFIALSSNGVKLAQNVQKQIVTGPVLIPDKNIYRVDENGHGYFIRFSAKTIEAIRNKFFKEKRIDQTNSQHEIPLQNNHIVESWTIQDPALDKSAVLGLTGLPAGTWMLSYRINDSNYWKNEILSGKCKGFSLEGVFGMKPLKLASMKLSVAQNPQTEQWRKDLAGLNNQIEELQGVVNILTFIQELNKLNAQMKKEEIARTKPKVLSPAQQRLSSIRNYEAEKEIQANLSYTPPVKTKLSHAQQRMAKLRQDKD